MYGEEKTSEEGSNIFFNWVKKQNKVTGDSPWILLLGLAIRPDKEDVTFRRV